MQELHADYLVIGSGAMGMAFTDTLMTETDATVIMVDRYHQPGGHWTTAYPFVRLHQPSAFYGVNSKHLGSDTIDQTGWNQGLYELATNGEVCAYFDQIMQQQFLPSGRVQYFPMCESNGEVTFRSLVSHNKYKANVTKIVDATYMNVTVPSMRAPAYAVATGVHCKPPNALPKVSGEYESYVVIGAGKTGMDACLFLLKNGVDPNAIAWVMPRDSWILDRAFIQPGQLFAQSIGSAFFAQTKVMAQANSIKELIEGVAKIGLIIRFDDKIWPTMYRCATVTTTELEQLRRIDNVIRLGRVLAIDQNEITLDEGVVPMSGNTLHIDCSADGLERRPALPVFDDNRITLQSVRTCQQVFSAAFIGHIEATYSNEAEKNDLCTPVPHPDTDIDFVKSGLANALNSARWATDPTLNAWLQAARLDGFTNDASDSESTPESIASAAALTTQVQKLGAAAINNMQKLLIGS